MGTDVIEGLYNELLETRRHRDHLLVALKDIAGSGPVDQYGNDDPYAGWSWCYDRAQQAISDVEGVEGGKTA